MYVSLEDERLIYGTCVLRDGSAFHWFVTRCEDFPRKFFGQRAVVRVNALNDPVPLHPEPILATVPRARASRSRVLLQGLRAKAPYFLLY